MKWQLPGHSSTVLQAAETIADMRGTEERVETLIVRRRIRVSISGRG